MCTLCYAEPGVISLCGEGHVGAACFRLYGEIPESLDDETMVATARQLEAGQDLRDDVKAGLFVARAGGPDL